MDNGTPARPRSAAARAATVFFAAAYLYACCVAFDAFLFKFGNWLPLPGPVKELCTSFNFFDYTTHPLYRKWLKGFVMWPGKPWTYRFRGDTFRDFDVPEGMPEFTLPVDGSGFIDTLPARDAQALVIGDSFVRSSGCRPDQTIPAYFEKLSGLKTYSAGQAGFGWKHYLAIFRHFVEGDPAGPEHFSGKEVFVVFYAGNDFTDTQTFDQRQDDENHWKPGHYFALRTLRKMVALSFNGFKNVVRRALHRPPDTTEFDEAELIPYSKPKASTARGPITQAMTRGFYPHALSAPAYRDTPFAFNIYIRHYKTLDWVFDDKMKDEIREVFAEFKRVADRAGIRLHFVLLPTNAQTLRPYLADLHNPPQHLFDQIYPAAVANFDILTDFTEKELTARGLDGMNMKPRLQEGVKTRQLLWPGDTHLTPDGNETVAKAMAARIGKAFKERS